MCYAFLIVALSADTCSIFILFCLQAFLFLFFRSSGGCAPAVIFYILFLRVTYAT
ncbi:hypothetical protein T492DRAFT_992024 [Pavlovales sp. CCMP2436]|nr:hypothetical protein T492DRAFT_992024 [Pavlovales sp. CCMP2436]